MASVFNYFFPEEGFVVQPGYTHKKERGPHWSRKKAIADDHPEVKQLFGKFPLTIPITLLLVSSLYYGAYVLREANWFYVITLAYIFGATISHALWVMIHDCAHYLACKSKFGNTLLLCIADIPHIVPGAVTFAELHRFHHGHLNEAWDDPDLPVPVEDAIFGHTIVGKILWLILFPLIMVLRQAAAVMYHIPTKNRQLKLFTSFQLWVATNWILNISVNAAVFYYMGLKPFVFMFITFLFAIGLHPLGGRWISEHFESFNSGQETFSYYGPLNYVSMNVGYHVEHHDFPRVPWYYLPQITKLAPEHYSKLHSHRSYIRLLADFIFTPEWTLRSRAARPSYKLDNLEGKEKEEYIKNLHKY